MFIPSILGGQSLSLGATPQLEVGYAQGVSGHITHYIGGEIVMAGGCNFPGLPASEGGVKHFYSDIYKGRVETRDSVSQIVWRVVGHLPKALAYAASVSWRGVVIVAGGKGEGGDSDEVYMLSDIVGDSCIVHSLPSLPEPRSAMASALVEDRYLYLIGGEIAGKPSSSAISLDLLDLERGWQEELSYPNAPLLKVLATSHVYKGEQCIFLFGAFAGVGEGGEISTSLSGWRFSPQRKSWTEVTLPSESVLGNTTWGGGLIFSDGVGIHLAGGVNARRFVPALQRIEYMRRARERGDSRLLDALQQESRLYLLHSVEWHEFTPYRYTYYPAMDSWYRSNPEPSYSRADATWISSEIGTIILGGEIKPGQRTPSISLVGKSR